MKIVIVTAFSPKWSNIASARWENMARYLSKRNEVYIVTSNLKDHPTREYDVGSAKLIEIPAKSFRRNYNLSGFRGRVGKGLTYKLKVEATYILEHIFPLSSGGIILHDFKKYLEETSKIIEPGSILVTSYGPWFTLKVGSIMKKKFENIIWIADFRDPSFDIPESAITRIVFFRKSTEKILGRADAITVVSKSMKEDYSMIYRGKILFLPNGYDGSIEVKPSIRKKKGEITIAYTGSLYMKSRNIEPFFVALRNLLKVCDGCKVKFVYAGKDHDLVDNVARIHGLEKVVENMGLVPKDVALSIQRSADLLLLLVYTGNDPREGCGIRTGKVYEYLASGKPILAIAPRSWEMKEEIESDGISKVFEKNEIENMVKYMLDLIVSDEVYVDDEKRSSILEKYLYENLSSYFEKEIRKLTEAGGHKK